ncbi:hypothetical protein H072_10797 [Dactylellina haptotyla CBS 200.50]|uniref:NmrA-like domain-containing protein n=1 Tax=Dactylellina haptotyla (strain CBS 200.50) TaxID=1284197 RepID=S8A3U9_DACHA|nr:hypothetical protein H072_10797 [Dactylellina haptotyla CBS 200.50]
MVKIAVAGGTGQVAREVIDKLVATGKHDIIVLCRTAPVIDIPSDIRWMSVNYNDKTGLAEVLSGVHTVLSFIQLLSDPNQIAQKNLIDAAIEAGVKRFAPSEYGSKETVHMPWWDGKGKVREYLQEVNQKETVIEYTLIQPGLFLDYLAFPHKTSKYVDPLQTIFDFEHKRTIVVDGHEDSIMTFTTVADLAGIIALAVDYQGKWPTNGGIRGNRLTYSQVIEIGGRVRGHAFNVEKVQIDDLNAGELKTSWGLEAVHRAVSQGDAAELLKSVSIGILLSSLKGAWDVSEDFNKLFPDYQFSSAETFLRNVWVGK